mgnify:FL=1|jgi:hypothetical protein|tara:strand:+ start:180 stop:398 length:219 start_codon:yes stop_codon:yes gene_type:complete
MSDVIIWKQDNGVLAITHPALNCGLTIDEIAKKDLPTGKKYKIISSTELPNWDEFRDAWTCPDDYLDTGVAD